ncbi:LamG domain-containing protein [Candidatus Poribacteria bacterium]|nr:LamG domain-containing protein [Candidatus Poribacteria bacterium]
MRLNKSVSLVITIIGLFAILQISSYADFGYDNIRGMWLFDEGSGEVATDSSKNENDGTIHGASWVDGKFGQALEFDGATNWVEVPHSDTVGFEAGVSFSLTVYYKGTSVGGSLAGKNYEDKTQVLPWYMLWNGGGDGKITFFLRNADSQSFRPISTSDISDDTWHFIAGVANADTGKASLWIDGKMEAELDYPTDSGYGNSEGVFHIGRHFDRYTTGIIDEVVLYDVALNEADLESIMNNGLATITAVEADGKLATSWGSLKSKAIY